MRGLKKRYILLFSCFLSIGLNLSFLLSKIQSHKEKKISKEKEVLVINVRKVGRKNGEDKRDTVRLKDLSTQSIEDLLSRKTELSKNKINTVKQRKSALESIQMKSDDIPSIAGTDSNLVLNSGIKFESKKGVPIDELNTQELVYYGFKNRTAIQYKNAVVKNINILKKDNPSLFRRIQNTIHNMRGKISYDRNGNVVNIKILQWSDSNEVQDFFLNALKDIRAIPNPPEGILDEEGFRATYELKLIL